MKASYLVSAALIAASAMPAAAGEISDGKVKIGILNDQSGVYADFGGKWSVEAAKMAVEDFGGKVQGAPIEIVSADHQTSRTSPPTSRASGTILSRSTRSWSSRHLP